jgi:hypothetical protein
MKCITKYCDKNVRRFIISKENAINPLTCEIGELRQLFGYFQYKAPNTSSFQSETLDEVYHEDLYKEMMKSWKEDSYNIISHNINFDKKSQDYALNGSAICSYCKRYLCKRKKSPKGSNGKKESDFDCLVRHLRNSLAHGRVFVIHGGNSIKVMFEDYDERSEAISARIVCNQANLKKWRTYINNYIKKQR